MAGTSPAGVAPKRSYRLGKRLESIDRTRQRIIEAATELFAGPSPARISLDDVAAKAGVSRATVYYQFKSRQELLDTIVVAAAQKAGMGNFRPPASYPTHATRPMRTCVVPPRSGRHAAVSSPT